MAPQAKSILSLLNDVQSDEIVLPDLQRDFVWEEDQIRLLLDSIMRGYPVGSLLFWNTQFLEVVYRDFVRDYKKGQTFATKVKPKGKRMRMVLDGQQRLQSLHIAVHGTFDGRRLWFNITSGPRLTESEENETNYRFEFWRDDEPNRPKRLVRVADVVRWQPRFERQEIEKTIAVVGLSGDEADAARDNIQLLRRVFVEDNVPIVTIDEDVIEEAQARSIDDILEIFVRANSGGTRLSRSDLMFSLIKTKWTGARARFDSLLEDIGSVGGLAIDKDFLIRALLTVANVPTKFDVDTINRHWDAMEPRFPALSNAIKAAIDFCRASDVRLNSAALITPVTTLLPVVYYLSNRENGSVPDQERRSLRTLIYFLLFNEFLSSKSPEARIRYLREVFQKKPGAVVPLDSLLAQIAKRQRVHSTTTTFEMLNWNPRLALSIAQPNAAKETLSWQEKAEVDHVFPQSIYRPIVGERVDDIGNLAYLGKLRNIRKRDQLPHEYFSSIPDVELREDFLIPDRTLLAPENFLELSAARREIILSRVRDFLGR